MLGYAITCAISSKHKQIGVNAAYNESAKWFHENGLFQGYDAEGPSPQQLVLPASKYSKAMKNLEIKRVLSFLQPM